MKKNKAATKGESPKLDELVRDPAHPIETQDYVIATPAAETAMRAVARWIRNGTPGGAVTGGQRGGKTHFIQYSRDNLPIELGCKLPSLSFLCQSEQQGIRERAHYAWLVDSVGNELQSGSVVPLKRRLEERLVGLVRATKQNRLVLFFDDAHNLTIPQLAWLSDLFNRLKQPSLKIRPTFVMVGQPELEDLRVSLLQAKKTQLVGRFMVKGYEFHGIRSARELAVCVSGYDTTLHNGIPYTQQYFPAAFKKGWRLEKLSDLLWKRFGELRAANGLGELRELTMQSFALTIEGILKTYGSMQALRPAIGAGEIDAAIEESGYLESEYSIQSPD